VAIINEPLSRALWPEHDAVGRTLTASGRNLRVVGVASEARYFSLEEPSGPELYMPMGQTGDFQVVDMVVRTERSATQLAPSLRAAMARVDPALPVADVQTLDHLMAQTVFERRVVALLVVGFSVFGLVLAAIGLYAVIAYSVHQRRPEIAIRMAMGAEPGTVRSQVFLDTFRLVGIGVAIGLPAAWLSGRAMSSLLYGLTPSDPLTMVSVLAVLVAVSGLAGYAPARRAAHVDPITALRSD
jgi:predicted lysophospholipase L1 biosynthesis ABC-type transport system permease subunit